MTENNFLIPLALHHVHRGMGRTPILPYPILPYPNLPYPILYYSILPYPILSYPRVYLQSVLELSLTFSVADSYTTQCQVSQGLHMTPVFQDSSQNRRAGGPVLSDPETHCDAHLLWDLKKDYLILKNILFV